MYIHIPFCKSRCIYCDFFSTTRTELMDDYIEALTNELRHRCDGHTYDTLYMGGGTPSWLGTERLRHLLNEVAHYGKEECEFTVECNPDDVTEDLSLMLAHTKVNRVSLGVQSLTDERLRLVGRRHTSQQAFDAVRRLQAIGIENISIDMMYGLPGQSMDEWQRDLDKALSLGTKHLSAYSLMYEEGTPLWRMREQHRVTEAHEELSVAMYEHLIDSCANAGFVQYELSNFAINGFESQHNSAYWEGKAYEGIGAGAHAYDGATTRRMNISNLERYIAYWKRNEGSEPVETEHLSNEQQFNERVFTALRTRQGLDWAKLENDFPTLTAQIRQIAQRHLSAGNLVMTNGRLRLTRHALFVSDDVMSDLMSV